MKKIVIVDDQENILNFLKYHLQEEKARVFTFRYGMEAIQFILENQVDLLICDWMPKDLNGLEICKWIKGNRSLEKIPFFMLSSGGTEEEVVQAFEMGADEYMLKPVRIRELLARIKKIFGENRSVQPAQEFLTHLPETDDPIRYHDIFIDPETYSVNVEGEQVELTLMEFNLLQMLISKPGKVYSRNQIIEKLKGLDYNTTERAVDVQIVGLRKKIGKYRTHLETVRGVGYRMRSNQMH